MLFVQHTHLFRIYLIIWTKRAEVYNKSHCYVHNFPPPPWSSQSSTFIQLSSNYVCYCLQLFIYSTARHFRCVWLTQPQFTVRTCVQLLIILMFSVTSRNLEQRRSYDSKATITAVTHRSITAGGPLRLHNHNFFPFWQLLFTLYNGYNTTNTTCLQ